MTSGIDHPPELIRALAEAARLCPLGEKLVAAPSYRVGAEWIDWAARCNGGVANLRPVTPARLLLDFAGDEMRRRNLRPPGAEETVALVGRLFASARGAGEGGYFTRLPASFPLVETIAASLGELDGAGLAGLGRTAGHFASREKFDELAHLFRRYRARRARAGVAGGAELLDCALAGVRARADRGDLPLLLLPESIREDADPRSLAFFGAWPEDRLRMLAEDGGAPSAAFSLQPADCAANEARQAFRTIFREGAPLDSVEFILTDARTYIPALCEAGMEAFGCSAEALPLTFHAGVPVLHSRPARLLAAWLRWLGGDLPPAGLAAMLRDRLLGEPWRGAAPEATPEDLAARVLRLPVYGAVEEYVRALGRDRSGEEGGDRDPLRGAEQWLARHLRGILPLAADGRTLDVDSAPVVLRAARELLRLADHASSRFDAYAAAALAAAFDAWLPHCDWPGFRPLAWLENLVAALRVMGLGPRPGAAHVADIASGGFSGRRRAFLLGLDEGRFPGASRQDPVLLDRERTRLSRALPLSARSRERREAAMRRLLARLRGSVTLSYARHDGGGGEGEQYPAPVYSRFAEEGVPAAAALSPAVLRPAGAGELVCGRDALLWIALASGRAGLAPADFAPWRPGLARGREARDARLRGEASACNGLVPEAGEDYRRDPWPVSPTDLETLAANPAEYFYKRVLKIAPPERFAPAPGKWLEGNERGDLVHTLFQDFVQELIDNADAVDDASMDRHRERLLDMLEQKLRRFRRRKPVRDDLAYERERGALIEACVIFLGAERARSAEGRPVRLEAALGGAAEDAPPWERREPVELPLPSGEILRLKGRIDRVDRLRDHGGLVLWDYKTGRSEGFSRADPFQGGRHLQPLLYCLMLEAALREAGLPEPVRRFAYFFPMPRDEGNVIRYAREQLAGEGLEIVDSLRALLAGGRYPLASSPKEFAYSDYLPLFS